MFKQSNICLKDPGSVSVTTKSNKSRPKTFSTTFKHSENAKQELELFTKFAREHLVTENGGPLVLEEWQEEIFLDHFDGAQEMVVLVGKGNGKTTMFGALAIWHLLSTKEARCYIAAASRDQASLMYQHAQGFVQRSERLAQAITVRSGYRELRSKQDSGFIKVLASDSNTSDGVAPSLALVDELHRHKTPDLYAVFRDGLNKRQGQMVTISTAGADLDSPLGKLREQAHLLEDREQDGFHLRARSSDRSFVAHEWMVPIGQDVDDVEIVKKANPSSFVTVEDLRRRHESPSMHKREWLRYSCNQWVQGLEDAWISPGLWAGLYDSDAYLQQGQQVWVGVDIGLRSDTSAVVIIGKRDDGRWVVESEVFLPPEGGEVALAEVEGYIMNLFDKFEVQAVVYDRWAFSRSAQEIEARRPGATVEFPMTNERTVPACSRLLEAINRAELCHNGDTTLEAHVEAGTVKMTERGWRIAKAPRGRAGRGKIDALIALLLAFTVASSTDAQSVYEDRELIII